MKATTIYLFIFFLAGCTTNKHGVILEESDNREKADQIIFLTYQIKNHEGNLSASLLSKKKVEGSLKSRKNEPSQDYLHCKQLGKDSVILDEVSIENPLEKIVEYTNESGMLQKKTIQLDSTEFTIRMQLNSKTKSIILEQIVPENQLLLTHKP